MLQSLHIQNYALIEKLNIEFQNGFSVITGETGAGKSIILGALGMLLGERAEAKSIKAGATRCIIEGHFRLEEYNLNVFFETNDLDYDNECIVRREMLSTGKSRAFINDTPVSVNILKDLGKELIDIHSQHQNVLINDEQFQINILDLLASNDVERNAYETCFALYTSILQQLKELRQTIEQTVSDQDFISFQLEQFDEAKLQIEEQKKLEEESEILSHTEEIKEGFFQTNERLQADDLGIIQKLQESKQLLQTISKVYPKAQTLAERTECVFIELKDIANEIGHELEEISFDPSRQTYVDDRLNTIYSLEKKHHVNSIEELLEIAHHLRCKLGDISNCEEHLRELESKQEIAQLELQQAATKLTKTRCKAATFIEKEMIERLVALGIPNIRFKVELEQRNKPDASGYDKISFLFSANKNAPLQNVVQVASGGEIARVMLSLKALISKSKNLPTLIFDEIDTGVSGSIAERMAITMYEMSRSKCQVISITHLPQIAAFGEHHYKVYKQDSDTESNTNIIALTEEQRITEIANMLSGTKLTDAAINNAKELLKQKKIK
ncbi:MAG: DNA repair protein RecN [Bacteroidaceae bacterium]